jgi:hypothetical protein
LGGVSATFIGQAVCFAQAMVKFGNKEQMGAMVG